MITITLSEDEASVLSDYLTHKLYKLESSGLTDSKCYPLLYSIHSKLMANANSERVHIDGTAHMEIKNNKVEYVIDEPEGVMPEELVKEFTKEPVSEQTSFKIGELFEWKVIDLKDYEFVLTKDNKIINLERLNKFGKHENLSEEEIKDWIDAYKDSYKYQIFIQDNVKKVGHKFSEMVKEIK